MGLPDLHVGKTPVGASYITKDIIYPHIIGNDIGCGIALFSTGLKRNKFRIDKSIKKLSKIESFIDRIDMKPLEIQRGVDEFINNPYKNKLGTIDSGNHFAEITEIDTIYAIDDAVSMGLDKKDLYMLVHSGSRGYGEDIYRRYLAKYDCSKGLIDGSKGFTEYLLEHEKGIRFAQINRELIAHNISNILNFKENNKLLDSVHNSINVKVYNNQKYYIHRKGAAPSDIGYVVIAGTRGTKSYIVKPKDGLFEYGFSVSHGAGRKWSRHGCKEKLEKLYSPKYIKESKFSSKFIYKDKNLIYEEAPEAYKNIEKVIEDMVSEDMIEIVASLNPILTYKV